MTVDGLVALARHRGLARLDAQWLVAHHLGRSRAWLVAHGDEDIDPALAQRCEHDFHRRFLGEPLAYIVGRSEFHGSSLKVSPAVLVPRPETEALVEWGLERLARRPAGAPPAQVVDLGTGSGAIALAIKRCAPSAEVTGTDKSAPALEVARDNGARLGLGVRWLDSDWWANLSGERFDLVLSNPPYIAEADPHLPALRHEPSTALIAGVDGLDDLRRIVAGALAHLRPGGWLLLEHGHDQGPDVRQLLQVHGLVDACTRQDLAGLDRLSGGQAPEVR
jgi:release factor glutamine methyltransferase